MGSEQDAVNRIRIGRTRMAALLLAGVFVFVSAGEVSAEVRYPAKAAEEEQEAGTDAGSTSYYQEKEHADMDYADMVYESVDPHALDALMEELDAVTDGTDTVEDPEQRTVELYHEMLQVMEAEYTNYVLGDLRHYQNVYDEDMNEKNRQDTLAIQDMSDAAYVSLQKALTGPYGSELRREFSDEQMSDLEEYEPLTDRERELIDRETELQQEYDRLSEEEYSFEYNGRTWTMEDLYADESEDYEEIEAVYLGITKQMNDAIVPVFQEMIKTRKEIAELEGYDTYTEYCYDVYYGRDFTGEDIAALRETIIRELKPLYEDLRMLQYMSDYNMDLERPLTGDEIVDTIGGHIGKVHPELTEAFAYMREHGLYCIDNTEEMLDVGFTSDLPEYGSAFIFEKTNGTVHDLETAVHEFGHFNAAYHAKQNVLMDSLLVDVAEIQSQGLEMLFLDEMMKILPDDSENLQLYLLINMLDSVLTGFEYDEFQQEIYAGGDMTQDELNRLAMDIDEKYTQYYYDDGGKAYEWVMINHTFTSPLYYIGYATSALSALDIWTESMEDRDAAIDKYMKLSAVPPDMPYQEATTGCGLRNMLEPENITALADEIRECSGLNSISGLDFGFPDIDSPFGFGEEIPFDFGEELPFGFGEEIPYDFGEVTPVEPYWVEPEGGDSAQPGGSEYQPDETDEMIETVARQTLRAVGISSVVTILSRLAVLIIALIAFFRKKNRNRGGDGFGGTGGWNDPNGWNRPGGWNDPNGWNGSGGWNGSNGAGGWNEDTDYPDRR